VPGAGTVPGVGAIPGGTTIKGFETLVRPASGNPGVPFNKATFPIPKDGNVNQTSATGFTLPPGN
ncbi:MAG: hypothetical protein AAFU85_23315, partial [Planctomycetota bacterium]